MIYEEVSTLPIINHIANMHNPAFYYSTLLITILCFITVRIQDFQIEEVQNMCPQRTSRGTKREVDPWVQGPLDGCGSFSVFDTLSCYLSLLF